MKNALLKTAFVLSVILLTIVFVVPAYGLLEYLLPADGRYPDGTQQRVDRLFPGVIVIFACVWAANRISGSLFWKTHLSDERWSIFARQRPRRA